jgi:hypothetical protein
MSTVFYLVSLKTMQKVEVACSVGASVRATQEPKALALFCEAHSTEVVEMMSEKDLEFRHLDRGELARWTDDDAEARYRALVGREPPTY